MKPSNFRKPSNSLGMKTNDFFEKPAKVENKPFRKAIQVSRKQ